MAELWFDAEAAAFLTALENDPTRPELAGLINGVLDQLESDPGNASVRRRRLHRPALWCVPITTRTEEWVILWEPHPTLADSIAVQYIGPASLA